MEIEVRTYGMSTFPVAVRVKASDGDARRAIQQVDASEILQSSAQFIAHEIRSRQSGLGSLLRVAWAN